MSTSTFDFEKFSTLQSLELHDYMEPLIANTYLRISDDEVDELMDRLDEYDHFHLVYAMLMCSNFAPERFVEFLPKYLSHNEMSVRAAATNILRGLNPRLITPRLIAIVEEVASEQKSDYLRTLANELKVCNKDN